jgi:hypothetical protein
MVVKCGYSFFKLAQAVNGRVLERRGVDDHVVQAGRRARQQAGLWRALA